MAGRALPRRPRLPRHPACSLARVAHGGSKHYRSCRSSPEPSHGGSTSGTEAAAEPAGTQAGAAPTVGCSPRARRGNPSAPLAARSRGSRRRRGAEHGEVHGGCAQSRGGRPRRAEQGPVAALKAGAGDAQSRVGGDAQSRGRRRADQRPAADGAGAGGTAARKGEIKKERI
jgi:hypothetical protein